MVFWHPTHPVQMLPSNSTSLGVYPLCSLWLHAALLFFPQSAHIFFSVFVSSLLWSHHSYCKGFYFNEGHTILLKLWSTNNFNNHHSIDNFNRCPQWFYFYSFVRHCFCFLGFAWVHNYSTVKQITLSGEITNKRKNQLFICAFLCIATARIPTTGLFWVLISIYFYTLIKISQHFGMNICVLCNRYGVKNRWS